EASRRELAAADAGERSAPLRKEALAAGLARVARLRAAQIEEGFQRLPGAIPSVEWGTSSYATLRREARAELGCRYSVADEDRWVAVTLDVRDRVVAGDPERGVPPDP